MKKLLIIDARMIGPFGHGISKYVEGIAESFQDGDALTDLLVQSAKPHKNTEMLISAH
jgi:hypothetical protein